MHGLRPSVAGRWLALAAAGLLIVPAVARADSFTVTGTADGGACEGLTCPSIRAALQSARDGDTIRVGAGDHRLTLGQLTVARSVTITGAGAQRTRILGDPQQDVRVFEVGGDVSVQPSVTIAHLTLAEGAASCSAGGNLRNYGRLRLHHVRVTGGIAETGGGIANFGSLTVEQSLVDGNAAIRCELDGTAGGVYSEGAVDDALIVSDSTVAYNSAGTGGGIVALDFSQQEPSPLGTRLARVTLARNRASAGAGGLYLYARTRAQISGSLMAENTVDPPASAASAPVPSNCGTVRPEDGGGNLVDHADCGFAGLPADPRLGEPTAGLGETPVLPIASDSPAIDHAGVCGGADQRDLPRPQGAACDAGAYEVAVAPMIESGPSGATNDAAPVFAFSGAPAFECRLDGPTGAGAWEPCASPKAYSALAAGGYRFSVRGADGGAASTRAFSVLSPLPPALIPAAPAQTPAPTPTPAVSPQYRRSVVARPTSGTVKVRLPGSRRYVDLDAIGSLPFGASIDARQGRVRIYAARDAAGRLQAASFYGGVFRIRQRGRFIELQLRGPKPVCGSRAASASADKPKKKRKARTRRLWGSGKGAFRTSGRYSAATVRGTRWLVEDRCRSTVTRVVSGVVSVRDFQRKRTVRLRAGGRYVARKT